MNSIVEARDRELMNNPFGFTDSKMLGSTSIYIKYSMIDDDLPCPVAIELYGSTKHCQWEMNMRVSGHFGKTTAQDICKLSVMEKARVLTTRTEILKKFRHEYNPKEIISNALRHSFNNNVRCFVDAGYRVTRLPDSHFGILATNPDWRDVKTETRKLTFRQFISFDQ